MLKLKLKLMIAKGRCCGKANSVVLSKVCNSIQNLNAMFFVESVIIALIHERKEEFQATQGISLSFIPN